MTKKGICLVSGGLDSSLALIELLKQGHTVRPLFVDYGQWAGEPELKAVQRIIPHALGFLGFKNCLGLIKVDLDWGEEVGSAWQ